MQLTNVLTLLAMLGATTTALPSPEIDERVTSEARNSTSLIAPVPLSNSWAMQTWTGTSCQGTRLFWTVPDGYSCTNLQSVTSLKVTNFGGCSTTYYTGSGCQGSPVHVDSVNSCKGYSQGERIGSFSVQC